MLLLEESRNYPTAKMCYLGTYINKKDQETGKEYLVNAYDDYYKFHKYDYDNPFSSDGPKLVTGREMSVEEFMRDKHLAYCFKCKKVVRLNSFSTFTTQARFVNTESVLQCPCCGTTEVPTHMYNIDSRYRLYLTHFVDDNKLKIRGKEIAFHFKQGNFYMKTYESLTTLNLDTGMAYSFPEKVNGIVPKKHRGKVINCTYRSVNIAGITAKKHNKNTVETRDALISIYNSIREYKMKKLGVYIPTFNEQAKEAFSIDPNLELYKVFSNIPDFKGSKITWNRDDYKTDKQIKTYNDVIESKEYKVGMIEQHILVESLLLFNRFPCINIYKANSILEGGITNDWRLDPKENKRLQKFIRMIKPDSINPIKDLCKISEVPYSKKNRRYFNLKAVNILLFKGLIKSEFKTDSINKIFEAVSTLRGNFSATEVNVILKFIKDQIRNEDFIENSFVNKLCKELTEEVSSNRTYGDKIHYLADYAQTLNLILEINPEYKLSYRNYSIRELHDISSSDYNKLRRANKEIPYEEKDYELNGTFGDYTFTIAKDTHTLIDVGSKMHICVGGYDRSAMTKNCTIVICTNNASEEEYEVCIELDRRYYVKQTKRHRNRSIEYNSDIEKALMEWIATNKLCISTHDINYVTIAKYYVNNPDIYAKFDKDDFRYKTLEEYKRDIKQAEEPDTFLDSEAEVI